MIIQTNLNDDDFEILTDFCNSAHISVSALLKTLVLDFLNTTDKRRIAYIVGEAQKIKPGRPKEGDY